jgi:hypothetical protein
MRGEGEAAEVEPEAGGGAAGGGGEGGAGEEEGGGVQGYENGSVDPERLERDDGEGEGVEAGEDGEELGGGDEVPTVSGGLADAEAEEEEGEEEEEKRECLERGY